ncbi:winged helix-turn-helix domain-containing protein [Thermomonospora umbrina]|uniref:winged helix-turn-helix domain-containing protein n=1 Tax=Thermomonospora umbrina TaxID=111806 RepID=UPI001476C91A|nr:winged helix-turn-helix domain-containing protein [Thermomonospora umbrina]
MVAVQQQTAQAAELASIAGQNRLADPRTNPAVRAHADGLRDEQHRRTLDAEHARSVRRHRVADRRASHAEKALEALQAARETSSPARSVLALHTGRSRFLAASLAASLALSAGSASGVARLAEKLAAPALAGWVAEVGMTGLTTAVVLYRSHLAQHGGKVVGWQNKVLWVLMLGPLLASVVANAFGAGLVGIACSVGAAAFSLLSYVIADASATAMRDQAVKVTGADEAGLRAVAMGHEEPAAEASELARITVSDPRESDGYARWDEIPTSPADPELWVSEQGRVTVEQVAAFLADQDPPDGAVTSSVPDPDSGGPHRSANAPDQPAADPVTGPVQIDADQPVRPIGSEDADRVTSAVTARRIAGQNTRQRVADYLSQNPDAQTRQIAEALGLSASTVKRHRREIQSSQ